MSIYAVFAKSKGNITPKAVFWDTVIKHQTEFYQLSFLKIISYLLPLQRGSSSLFSFSGKTFSNSVSETPFKVNDHLFRHKTHEIVFGMKCLLRDLLIYFFSSRPLMGVCQLQSPSTLNWLVRWIKSAEMEKPSKIYLFTLQWLWADSLGPHVSMFRLSQRMMSSSLGPSSSFYRMSLQWLNTILQTGAGKNIKMWMRRKELCSQGYL